MLLILIIILFIGIIVYSILTYNKIIRLDNQCNNAWSQIDVQLKRRHDLIPNLVETVKGYMQHEKDTLKKVIEARSKAVKANGVKEQIEAEDFLNKSLDRLILTVEDYPELKADKNFLELQEEITSTENRIAFSRQSYNDQVMHFNNKIKIFPSSIIANFAGFNLKEFFEIKLVEERKNVKINFT